MNNAFELIAAAFTPFDGAGALDIPIVARQAARLHTEAMDGAFVCGTTGEGAAMTGAERRSLAAEWARFASDRFRVIVHVGHASAHEARDLAAHAQQVGASATAAVLPYFLKPRSAEEAVEALHLIATGAPDLPFFYYHIPAVTGIALPAAEIVERARHRIPNFAGIKFTDADLNDLGRTIALCDEDLAVYFGRDDLLLPALSLGVRRAVGMSFNYTGPVARSLISAFDRNDLGVARAEQNRLRRLINAAIPYGIINALKAVSPLLSVDCGPCRSPLSAVTAAQAKALADVLRTDSSRDAGDASLAIAA